MSLFARETPRDFYPPGYDPTHNRYPPSRISCLPCAVIGLVVLIVLFGGALFLLSRGGAKKTIIVTDTSSPTLEAMSSTPTLAPSPTLDAWSMTGTAIFFATSTATPTPSPTLDYCWFLTPQPPTPQPTIYVTMDGAQLLATAQALRLGTPIPTPTSTDEPPRAWCNQYLLTQPTSSGTVLSDDQKTATAAAWPTPKALPSVAAPATWTPRPNIVSRPANVQQSPAPTQPPALPAQPPQVYITQVYVQAPTQVQIIVITATLAPSNTPSRTPTSTPTSTNTATDLPSATATFTDTATDVPSDTPTDTATDVPTDTPTATDVPTDVPTATATFTDTATDIPPTPTFTFTWTPSPTDTLPAGTEQVS